MPSEIGEMLVFSMGFTMLSRLTLHSWARVILWYQLLEQL